MLSYGQNFNLLDLNFFFFILSQFFTTNPMLMMIWSENARVNCKMPVFGFLRFLALLVKLSFEKYLNMVYAAVLEFCTFAYDFVMRIYIAKCKYNKYWQYQIKENWDNGDKRGPWCDDYKAPTWKESEPKTTTPEPENAVEPQDKEMDLVGDLLEEIIGEPDVPTNSQQKEEETLEQKEKEEEEVDIMTEIYREILRESGQPEDDEETQSIPSGDEGAN